MENPADTAAIAAAMRDPANDATHQDVHAVPSAESSQAQETIPYAVADPPDMPEPADPANPHGGIQP
jgi:hypothetical protein